MSWLAVVLGGVCATAVSVSRLFQELRAFRLLVTARAARLVITMAVLSFVIGGASAEAVRQVGEAKGWVALQTPFAFIVVGLIPLLSLIPVRAGRRGLETVWSVLQERLKNELLTHRMEECERFGQDLRRLGITPARLAQRMTEQIRATREGDAVAEDVGRVNAVQKHARYRMERLVELIYLLELWPLLRRLRKEVKGARRGRRGHRRRGQGPGPSRPVRRGSG